MVPRHALRTPHGRGLKDELVGCKSRHFTGGHHHDSAAHAFAQHRQGQAGVALAQLCGDVAQVAQQRVRSGPDARFGVGPKAALVVGVHRGLNSVHQVLGEGLKGLAVVVEAVHGQHDVLGLGADPDPCSQEVPARQAEGGGIGWYRIGLCDFVRHRGHHGHCNVPRGRRASRQQRNARTGEAAKKAYVGWCHSCCLS